MTNLELKKLFGKIAQDYGFERAYGGWFKESEECILVLDLQRSSYSNLYYLNIKILVQGAFPEYYGGELRKSKELVKKYIGEVDRRAPSEFTAAFDLENLISDSKRKTIITELFLSYLKTFAEKALSRNGIRQLAKNGEIHLEEPIIKELERLDMKTLNTG